MIKVKTFKMNTQNIAHHEKLDNVINKFLEENDVEVIDIKYSTCCHLGSMGGSCWIPSAMLIYKEKKS